MRKNEIITPEAAAQIGIWQYGFLDSEQIPFAEEIRQICKENVCRCYDSSWACPPAVGSFEACREKCLKYSKILVFSTRYQLEDSFDYDGMKAGLLDFKQVCDRLAGFAEKAVSDFLLLSNEKCFRCESCTYPEKPCRFPDKLFPSIEGFGIIVSELAQKAGMAYNNGKNTVTFFGGLLFGNKSIDKP